MRSLFDKQSTFNGTLLEVNNKIQQVDKQTVVFIFAVNPDKYKKESSRVL